MLPWKNSRSWAGSAALHLQDLSAEPQPSAVVLCTSRLVPLLQLWEGSLHQEARFLCPFQEISCLLWWDLDLLASQPCWFRPLLVPQLAVARSLSFFLRCLAQWRCAFTGSLTVAAKLFFLAKMTWMYILGGVEVNRSRRGGRSQLSVEAGCRNDLCSQVHHFSLPPENLWFRSCVSMLWVLFSVLAHLQVPSRSILLWVSRDLPWAAFLFLTRSPAGGCGEQEGKRGSATTERATGMHFTLQLVICSEANLQPGKLSKENVKEFFFKFNKVRFLEVCSHLRVFELSALQELVSHLHPSLSSFEVFRFRSHYVHLYLPNRKLIILCLSLIWF